VAISQQTGFRISSEDRPDEANLDAGSVGQMERVLAESFVPTHYRSVVAPYFEAAVSGSLAIMSAGGDEFSGGSVRGDADVARPGLVFSYADVGEIILNQDGRQSTIGTDLVIAFAQMPYTITAVAPVRSRLVFIPETMLGPSVGDISRFAGVSAGVNLPEFAMMTRYIASINLAGIATDPALGSLVCRHLAEVAVAGLSRLGGREDPTEGSGLRKVRLAEVKRLVTEMLGQPTLNAARVAKRLGVSERYVQKLMEQDGQTFSTYVNERRLGAAFDQIARLPPTGPTLREIAESLGFSDASQFSRAFRRRFGETAASVRGTRLY
jgi:AraC family transcriptional regulator, positive regulator of tynA and feaB